MPIYEIERRGVERPEEDFFENEPVSKNKVDNGRHVLKFAGVSVPISVEGDEVVVYISEAEGDLNNSNLGEDNLDDLRNQGVISIRFNLRRVSSSIYLYDERAALKSGDPIYKGLEWRENDD